MPAGPDTTTDTDCRFMVTTAALPGAIGMIHLHGDVLPVLTRLTGRSDWTVGRSRLADLGGADEGVVIRVSERVAFVMPHGGTVVMRRVCDALREAGARQRDDLPLMALFPEAESEHEARIMLALRGTSSPMAVDLLLAQRQRWQEGAEPTAADLERSKRLDRLILPPSVVVVGPPNVGKSTLCNALVGRSVSIALDQPGTTRDYTSVLVELAGLVVRWHDTPGLRETRDAIEREAIERAHRLIDEADFVIAMTDAEHDWPVVGRNIDLRVVNKCDMCRREDGDVHVSAVTGEGIEEFVRAVRDGLVPPGDVANPGLWVLGGQGLGAWVWDEGSRQ